RTIPVPDRSSTRIAAAFALLLANSAYLAAFAEPTLFYFANVVLHVALGIGVAVAGLRYLRARRPALTPLARATAILLGGAFAAGAAIMIVGATRPYRWLLYTHIVLAVIGSAAAAAALFAAARLAAGSEARRVGKGWRPGVGGRR